MNVKGFTMGLIFVLLFTKCKDRVVYAQVIGRDSTITPENAFSEMFLDSMLLEKFLTDANVDDNAAEKLRKFYQNRNYQFAWYTRDGLAEHARAFWNLHNNYIQSSNDSSLLDERLHMQIEQYLNADTSAFVAGTDLTESEFQLTSHFFRFAKHAYQGRIDPGELQWYIPRKKVDAIALLDSLVSVGGQNSSTWEPINPEYRKMAEQLRRYNTIRETGSWQNIDVQSNKSFRSGDSSAVIRQIRNRLSVTGDLVDNDSSAIFDEPLVIAVRHAQKRFGQKPTGIVNASLIKDLNISVEERVKQMLINMERMRWMPKDQSGDRIVANIPEFKLHVYKNHERMFDIKIVVGTEVNKTVIFNDVLKYVVFSPYWNIPPSIVRNEVQPSMLNNPSYLSQNNMEEIGVSNGLPIIRQRPGRNNALGKVKFIFPNSYNIYFHDTPAKFFFGKQKRAFSHGCIRLEEPSKLAIYLLRDQPEWTLERIKNAMNATTEKWVTLTTPVPVLITYFTSWIDEEGFVNFRDDIYGRDKKLAERLFIH